VLQAFLFGVDAWDMMVFITVPLLMLAVALAASCFQHSGRPA